MNTLPGEAMDAIAPRRESRATGAHFRRPFAAIVMLLFVAGTLVTIARCAPTLAMGAIPMPGGWTLSMAWVRMCGQAWPHAASSFLGMWMTMTLAMMLPVLAPGLWRYGQRLSTVATVRFGGLLTAVAAGYFFTWAVAGLAVYFVGATLAALALQSPGIARLAPLAAAAVIATAGMLQLGTWKKRQLEHCRRACGSGHAPSARALGAWGHGLRLGLRCNACCAPMTLTLLTLGVMDLRVMAATTVAIATERLAPDGQQIARASGVLMLVAGLALGLGMG